MLSGLTVLVHQYHSSSCFSKSQKGIVWSVRDSLTWAYDFCRVSLFWVTNRRHSLSSALCRSSLFQASTVGVKDLVRKLVGIDFVVTIAILEWCDDWHKFNVRTSSFVCWGCLDLSSTAWSMDSREAKPFSCMLTAEWFHLVVQCIKQHAMPCKTPELLRVPDFHSAGQMAAAAAAKAACQHLQPQIRIDQEATTHWLIKQLIDTASRPTIPLVELMKHTTTAMGLFSSLWASHWWVERRWVTPTQESENMFWHDLMLPLKKNATPKVL